MSEYESAAADAMNNVADAVRTLAASVCQLAAGQHTDTPYDQRNMGAVFWDDAKSRFPDILRRLNKRQRAELETYIQGLVKGR